MVQSRYVEVHMEQGPVLEALGKPLGVVTAIAGQSRLAVTLQGMQVGSPRWIGYPPPSPCPHPPPHFYKKAIACHANFPWHDFPPLLHSTVCSVVHARATTVCPARLIAAQHVAGMTYRALVC